MTGVNRQYVLLSFLSPFKNAHCAFLFDCMIWKYVWNISMELISTVQFYPCHRFTPGYLTCTCTWYMYMYMYMIPLAYSASMATLYHF